MRKPLRRKGLTLIEIIISLAILGIVIVPLSNLALTSVRIEKDSELKLEANNLAQQIIESIKEPSVALSNIDNNLKGDNLGLSSFDNDSIKATLLDISTEEIDDFMFYKTDIKDCYVRVRVSDIEYNPSLVNPINDKTSIWEEAKANFQYKLKIAKDVSDNLTLYKVPDIFKKDLNGTAVSTVLNITDNGSDLLYSIYQDGVFKFDETQLNTLEKKQDFNLQIEAGSPSIIINVESMDKTRTINLFIDELVKSEPYVANFKVFSKGKVGVYTKINKENQSFSDVEKIYKIEARIYKYKNGDKTLLQNITDYKYVK